MTIALRRLSVVSFLGAALASASCVPCTHPLCDEQASVVNDELVGDWFLYDGEKPGGHVSIGNKVEPANVMEIAFTGVDDQKHVRVERFDLFVTQVEALCVVVSKNDPEDSSDKGAEPTYNLWLFESRDKDTLDVYWLDSDVIARAIVAKQLHGKVERQGLFNWNSGVQQVTSSPEELHAFLESKGRACFATESPIWTLRRAQLK